MVSVTYCSLIGLFADFTKIMKKIARVLPAIAVTLETLHYSGSEPILLYSYLTYSFTHRP
jgi:hypothetical protein